MLRTGINQSITSSCTHLVWHYLAQPVQELARLVPCQVVGEVNNPTGGLLHCQGGHSSLQRQQQLSQTAHAPKEQQKNCCGAGPILTGSGSRSRIKNLFYTKLKKYSIEK